MRYLTLFLLLLLITSAHAQSDLFESYMKIGKQEFNKDFYNQDYQSAVDHFEKAVALKPENAEAHYFLGYSYGRLGSKDGNSIPNIQTSLVIKTSAEFEKVIKISPKYTGDFLLLDPYGKIASEWSCLALKFKIESNADSAIWAYKEGKRSGGFSELLLAYAKLNMNTCVDSAIIISIGDINLAAFSYLQDEEGFRKDIAIIDASLVNADWYPRYLAENKIVSFDMPNTVLDTLSYLFWEENIFSVKDFSWLLKPSYEDRVLLRGDRVLLSMLRENLFEREIYFLANMPSEYQLSLDSYLKPSNMLKKLIVTEQEENDFKSIKANFEKNLKLVRLANLNIREDNLIVSLMREQLIKSVYSFYFNKEYSKAKELMALLDQNIDEAIFPFEHLEFKEYTEKLREKLAKQRPGKKRKP